MKADKVVDKAFASVFFDTLAYVDKLSGVESSPYNKFSTCSSHILNGKVPSFLDGKKACGTYEKSVNNHLEVMYHGLLNFDDSLVRRFFRLEINTKNFLVWLRAKEMGVPHEGKIIYAGDYHPILSGQGVDMGFIPDRAEIFNMFQKGEWSSLALRIFSAWRKRLRILASFRSDIITEMILEYLKEEESRWIIKVS